MMRHAIRRLLLSGLVLAGHGAVLLPQTATALTYQVDWSSGGHGSFNPPYLETNSFQLHFSGGSIVLDGTLENGATLRVTALDLTGALSISPPEPCPPLFMNCDLSRGVPIRISLSPGDPNQLTLRREGDLLLWSGSIGLLMSGLSDFGAGAPSTGENVHAILVANERSPLFFEGTLPDVIGRPNFIAPDGFRLDGFVYVDPRGRSLLDGVGYLGLYAVPEPSTALLSISALLGLALRRRGRDRARP